MKSECTLCGFANKKILFKQKEIPVFQNKIFPNQETALSCIKVDVNLVQCENCGFVYNSTFDASLMNYDENYQNEQANSSFFQEHLRCVLDKVISIEGINGKVIEIGCGKGHFLEMLREKGVDCIGFDPTYEGKKEYVIKEYFSEKFSNINADVIILRHTLEHIHSPFSFIKQIAKANNYRGKIFIEVPTFNWIFKNEAFWDIFYEHCNYFTLDVLRGVFGKSEGNSFFGDQYIYVVGDLGTVKQKIDKRLDSNKFSLQHFKNNLNKIEVHLEKNESTAIWGAGGKGSTFLNLLDHGKRKIDYVIDINPVKQSKFISNTGHPIYSPNILSLKPVKHIIIMNSNYRAEIENTIKNEHEHGNSINIISI